MLATRIHIPEVDKTPPTGPWRIVACLIPRPYDVVRLKVGINDAEGLQVFKGRTNATHDGVVVERDSVRGDWRRKSVPRLFLRALKVIIRLV